MSKAMLYAAVSLAVALPFAAQAKSKPSSADGAAPASSSSSTTSDSASSSTAAPADQAAPSTATTSGAATTGAAGATAAPGAGASAATGTSTDANATAAAFTVGTPVKDNTGATIGSISELKPGASGAQMATIAMGQDKFAVATTGLAMQNGAAIINMTQAELQSKLHPAAPK